MSSKNCCNDSNEISIIDSPELPLEKECLCVESIASDEGGKVVIIVNGKSYDFSGSVDLSDLTTDQLCDLVAALDFSKLSGQQGSDIAEAQGCFTPVERLVFEPVPNTLNLIDGAYVEGTSPTLGNGNPGQAVIDSWISDNIDYSAATTPQSTLVAPDQNIFNQTDAGWAAFVIWVPAGASTNIAWTSPNEGYFQIEIDECVGGAYRRVDQGYTTGGVNNAVVVSHVLTEGYYAVRITQVDAGGLKSVWDYVGDPISVYPASSPPFIGYRTLYADCKGNLFEDSAGLTAYVGTLLTPDGWPCHIGGKVNASDVVGQASPPSYADDAAAGAGGIATGQYYQTDGTGAPPLDVAGILMVKQ